MSEWLNDLFLIVKNKTYELFKELKDSLGNSWIEDLVKKYGAESKIPWIERRFYLFRLIREKAKHFKNKLSDAREAFAAWLLFKKELLDLYNFTEKDLNEALETLGKLHEERKYPQGMFVWNPSRGEYKRIFLLSQYGVQEDIEAIERALDLGYYIYPYLKDISSLVLLALILPSLDVENKKIYLKEARFALKLAKLADFWYSLVEKREAPDKEHWSFWEKFLREMEK
ncbi:MAG: hypothetical protein ACTSX9_02895 [Candidatus Njordarchaeales archaeon]